MSLDSVAVAICQGSPSSPCIGDLFSRNSNIDFEFSVCSLDLIISHDPFHLFLFPFLCQHQWNSFPYLWENFVLATVRILQHLMGSSLSSLDPVWVQRTLLLQRREQLLLSTLDTYPTVTVGVDSVARVLQGEALPTPPS